MRLQVLGRLIAIQRVLVRHGLDEIVWRTHLFRPLAWARRLLPFGRSREPLGARLRAALEELGPIFVKFGQALSVRPDLLTAEVALELAKLQDQVAPFAGEQAVAALELAFGKPVDEVFAEFDREPLAAASIAQVHTAKLRTGQAVVVKVLRPNVAALIQRDVEVLYAIAELAEHYWPEARRLHPIEVVAVFVCRLAPGDYFISLGVATLQGEEVIPHDRRYDSIHLQVRSNSLFFGIADLDLEMMAGEARP